MATSIPALVKPAVLVWARESVGLVPVAASRRMQLPDDRVAQWESGEVQPTIANLRKAAEVYKRPLAVFFLDEPPADFDAMRDFRRVAGGVAGEWSPDLHGEFRRALRQREAAVELAEIEDDPPPTTWRIGPLPDGDEPVAAAARSVLLARSPLSLPPNVGTRYEHLNAWTAALEEAGVLVMATERGRVRTSEMRAFSLYSDVYPLIMVNGGDAARGRLFSMLHEYAHLLLHTGGLCDPVTATRATDPDSELEARCNAIAAAILMPADLVLARSEVQERARRRDPWSYEALRDAAAPFGVSAEAFARRLLTLGRIDRAFYQQYRAVLLQRYEQEEATGSSGGDFYRTKARDLGKGFVRRVADAHRRRVIDSYTAATFLSVKVEQIERLARMASLSESA